MKKIFRMALVCALAGATLLYTGCTKDYSDDIDDLKSQVSTLNTSVAALQKKIDDGCVITSVVKNAAGDGYVITTSDTKTYEIKNGADGADGKEGKEGKQGPKGDAAVVTIGSDGYWYINNEKQEVKAVAQDGVTPKVEISEDGYWVINGKKQSTKAKAENGVTPTIDISEDGYWVINGEKQSTKAKAEDGVTPTIGISEDGYWVINGEKQSTKAIATAVTIDKDGYICLDGKATTVKAGSMAVWDQTSGTVKFYKADGSLDFEIGVCELESIVFVPQLYFEGIEAAEYDYVYGNTQKANTKEVKNVKQDRYASDGKMADVVLVKGGKHSFANDKDYSLGEIAEAEYHVNPNSFDVTKATWKLEGVDKKYVTRAGATTETWSINTKSVTREAGKNAVVKYQIVNPHLATGTASPYVKSGEEASDVAVMRLSGTVKNGGKTVDSDYEAIVPYREQLRALAFTKASGYVTDWTDVDQDYAYSKADCPATIGEELYLNSKDAVQHVYSVDVQYQTPMDLAELIEIHVNPANTSEIHTVNAAAAKEVKYTLKEFNAKYGDEFKYNFELIPYKVGENVTEEQTYGQIDGSMFYPCWVEKDGKTQHRSDAANGKDDGKSSVDRQPVVLVTLTDAKNNVLLYGYFKIKIVNNQTFRKDFVITDFTLPYLCNVEAKTTWAQSSHIVLEEQLKMSYKEFINQYGNHYEKGVTYVKNDKGEFVASSDFGTLSYIKDNEGNTINDVYKAEFTKAQIDNVVADKNVYTNGRSVSLYVKFENSPSDYIYIGVTVTFEQPVTAKFISHNPDYWFKPAEHEAYDLLIVNPRVPTDGREDTEWSADSPTSITNPEFAWGGSKTGSTITGYSINLEKNWVYNAVQFEFDADVVKAFKEAGYTFGTKELPLKYHFEFNKNQTFKDADGNGFVVGLAPWNTKTTQALYWKEAKADNAIAYLNNDIVRTYDGTNDKGVRGTGSDSYENVDLLWYVHNGTKANSVAKTLLNKYAHPVETKKDLDEKLDYFLYADVDLIGTYGTCDIPCGTETFHVAFYRPLDINTNPVDGFKDATAGSDKVTLGTVFGVTDWQGRQIFVKDNGKYVAKTQTMTNGELNWAAFYGIESIEVDIDEVMTDQASAATGNAKDYLKDHGTGSYYKKGVNNAVILGVKADEAYTPAPTGCSMETITDATTGYKSISIKFGETPNYDALNYYVLYYDNYTGADNFNFYVPITIKYWWGELKDTVTIPVVRTINK